MSKTILLTGATDGIGLETARRLATAGHTLLLHGRNTRKLEATRAMLAELGGAELAVYEADLSSLEATRIMAREIASTHQHLDVIINNAGVYKLSGATMKNGLDLRILVNTLAPYVLTRELLPLMSPEGRVINLSSAAQAPVNPQAIFAGCSMNDGEAYAQSKLALTMWTFHLAHENSPGAPAFIAINPGSLLASKMVKEAFGLEGKDLAVGADILFQAALDDGFANASGRYYDNDSGRFAEPHADAGNPQKNAALVAAIERYLQRESL